MSTICSFGRASAPLALALAAACATTSAGKSAGSSNAVAPSSQRQRVLPPETALAQAAKAYESGSYQVAESLYEQLDRGGRAPSIAIFRLATLRSWDGRLDEAISLYRRYIAAEPLDAEGRLALARTLAWGGNYSAAIATYDTLIAKGQRPRDAILGRAQTLAWSGELGDALAVYKKWLSDHPTDHAAAMDYARALAWNDQMDEAEALYAELARTGDAGATKGLARVIGWKGDLGRSESTWRQALVIAPADPEALTGLAQVLSWQGRQTDAESALQSALRANPAYGDARALMRWVQADLRPNVTVTAVNTNDSDHNRATTLSIDYGARAPWSGSLGARYTGRMANFATTDSRADAVNVFGRWQPTGTTWQIRVDGGLTHHSSTFVPTTPKKEMIANGGLRVSGNLGHSLMVGLSGSRAPFDETALLIANGIVSSELAAEATLSLPLRFSLSAAGSHARLTGGTRENNREAYSSTVRWNASRRWSVGVDARRFGYDTASSDGYFSPRRYTLVEATGRGHVGGNLGWNADADVGLGNQSIDLFGASTVTRLAERASLVFGYRFDPAHELSATGSYANVAAPGQNTGTEYKWYSMALRARVGF